jgi:hypothetical protein
MEGICCDHLQARLQRVEKINWNLNKEDNMS